MEFEENRRFLLRESLMKPKTGLPNFNFYQFFYDERLSHWKRHLKRNLCIEFKENHLSHISLNHFRNLKLA